MNTITLDATDLARVWSLVPVLMARDDGLTLVRALGHAAGLYESLRTNVKDAATPKLAVYRYEEIGGGAKLSVTPY